MRFARIWLVETEPALRGGHGRGAYVLYCNRERGECDAVCGEWTDVQSEGAFGMKWGGDRCLVYGEVKRRMRVWGSCRDRCSEG
jgi:hypothetical protein